MPSWFDRAVAFVSPTQGLRRQRARMASDLLARHYEGAASGRRTSGWYRSTTDANAASGTSLAKLRDAARDLVRNNPYASAAVDTIANHTVGWGIVPSAVHAGWNAWAGSTAMDADGRCDLPALEKAVMRALATDGEVLIRRRWRRPSDGLPLPVQVQLLEADYLDTSRDGPLPSGRVVRGVEFDAIGRRMAYWLFREHPGSATTTGSLSGSVRVPATEIIHAYKLDRAGQVRGPSWFAPVLLRFKDFDDFEDATLMKQKVSACLAVLTSDVDGSAPALGATDTSDPSQDALEPGMILNIPSGRQVHVVQPPASTDYPEYSKTVLRAIATGLGVTYEDLTGDYTNLPYSAARMSRMRHWSHVQDWRWRLLIPQVLDPLWGWAMEASALMQGPVTPSTEWTAPALPLIDPDKEAMATMRQIRSGQTTISEAIRERGYRPDQFLAELAADFKRLDALGLVLDIDPRRMTQAGQAQAAATPTAAEAASTDDADEADAE